MTKEEVMNRLASIKERMCDQQTFIRLYGINLWERTSEAAGVFKVWNDRRSNKSQVLLENKVDRWAFELFLQQEHLLPLKNASIHFAMSEDDFKNVISCMCDNSMIASSLREGIVPGLYPTSWLEDLYKKLPSLKMRFFYSETQFILLFHEAISKDLGIKVETIYSEASKMLKDVNFVTANEFDVITDEPMGNNYQVWLDFKKPLALKPDACSLVTYINYEDILKDWCFSPPSESELNKSRCRLQSA